MVRFTTKKIDSLTLGERMKKMRNERHLSLSEISKSTKIQTKYLEYLEEGEYTKLPADVYVKGFLRSYSIFMGLNECALIKQFEREKGIHKNIKNISDCETPSSPISFSSLVITPKMIIISIVTLLLLSSFVYLYAQVNNFVSEPRLVIIKPSDGSSTDGNVTHVTGVTEKDSMVFINDQKVLVSENGEFSEDINLRPGQNVITIKSRSKFDKEATKTIMVSSNFQEQITEPTESGLEQANMVQEGIINPFSAEVWVESSAWVSIEIDGEIKYSGTLESKEIQTFNAQNNMIVTSDKGSKTLVKVNGKEIGSVSESDSGTQKASYDANGKIE